MKTYIHYGASVFDPGRLTQIVTDYAFSRSDKPAGLWASPTDPKAYGWREWCEAEEFHLESLNQHFLFRLKKGSKILTIRSLADAVPYLVSQDFRCVGFSKLDLRKIYAEFDAMELDLSENWGELRCSVFNTWDVDSIVVWKPDIVIPVAEEVAA